MGAIPTQLESQSASIDRIGELAVCACWLNPADVDYILTYQKQCGFKFGEAAIESKHLTMDQVRALLKVQEIRSLT